MAFVPGVSNKFLTLALLFIVVSHPATYGITNSLLSPLLGPLVGPIATPSGSPTAVGIIIHAIVFVYAQRYFA